VRNNIIKKQTLKSDFSQVGFTLVELLIVIVIIGILAGVVIGVLNPVQQQNRARDAGLRSQLDKMALSTKSLYASSPRTTNRAPTTNEFAQGIANYVVSTSAGSTDCIAGANANDAAWTGQCQFQLNGVGLPLGASPIGCQGLYNGDGANQCNFAYYRTPTTFRVAVKGWSRPSAVFVYSYIEDAATGTVTEGFWSCGTAYDITAAPAGCAALTN
jgi:prepilin-type N-terminal cleavage/methylation domain-containing protein